MIFVCLPAETTENGAVWLYWHPITPTFFF